MFKAPYYTADGKQESSQALPEVLFDGVVNEAVLHQVVKAYMANQRQGTAAAKSRSEVAGGSRKPWRQKGTGRARQGTIRAVQWAGGGVAFPPIPHSWRQRLPKKVKALARRSAFNSRAQDDRVILMDGLDFDTPKTSRLRDYLGSIGAEGKVLMLTDGLNENVYLSGRNLPNVQVQAFGTESVYEILWANLVLIERSALEPLADLPKIEKKWIEPEPEPVKPGKKRVRGERIQKKRAPGAAAKASEAKGQAAEEVPEPQTSEPSAPESLASESAVADAGDSGVEATQAPAKVELPKVSELKAVLSEINDVATIEAMHAQDSRKTALAHYESRLAELSGEDGDA